MSRHLRLVLALTLLVPACERESVAVDGSSQHVLASFYPLEYFAKRIAGDSVDVECPLPPDADPATWQPGREDIAAFQQAALVLVNGASFEHWVDKVSLPPSRVVDTAHAFHDRFLKFETVTHRHGAGGEHTHEGIDGHTWLDPNNAKLQSQAIHDAFVKAFPTHAQRFASGLAALHQDLDALDRDLEALAPRLSSNRILASHPAYSYVAARYGWKLTNLHLDPDAEPDASDKEALAKAAAAGGEGKAILLWESEPTPAMRAAAEAQRLTSVVFSPCETLAPARRKAGEDYLSVMRGNLKALESALAP